MTQLLSMLQSRSNLFFLKFLRENLVFSESDIVEVILFCFLITRHSRLTVHRDVD